MDQLSKKELTAFKEYLHQEEKSEATVEKYLHDVRCFYTFLEQRATEKTEVLAYKDVYKRQVPYNRQTKTRINFKDAGFGGRPVSLF